jgi:acyl-CoA thioesterase
LEEVIMAKKLSPQTKGFSPFRELVGVTFTKVENGYSQCILEVDGRLLNPYKALHGGATFTMVDTGMGAALWSCIGEDELCSTIETGIVYFKSVASGTLVCDTRVLNKSKRIATLESEIKHGGQLIAKAIGTWSIYKANRA